MALQFRRFLRKKGSPPLPPEQDVGPLPLELPPTADVVDVMPTARPMSEVDPEEAIVEMIDEIGGRLADQAARGEQLLTTLDRIGGAIGSLPEVNRHVAQLLETVAAHLGESRGRAEALGTTMKRLDDACERQGQLSEAVRQHIAAGNTALELLRGSLGSVERSLAALTASNIRAAEALDRLGSELEQRDLAMLDRLRHGTRWAIAAIATCAAAAATALVLVSI